MIWEDLGNEPLLSKEIEEKRKKELEIKFEEASISLTYFKENNYLKGKQYEEAKRDDCTVLMLNLSIKTGEKDIYQFFQKV